MIQTFDAIQLYIRGDLFVNKLLLQKMANEVRKGIINGTHAAESGHPGGSLSAAEVLTYLYFEEMNIDPADPGNPDRDRFVLSKGHATRCTRSLLCTGKQRLLSC